MNESENVKQQVNLDGLESIAIDSQTWRVEAVVLVADNGTRNTFVLNQVKHGQPKVVSYNIEIKCSSLSSLNGNSDVRLTIQGLLCLQNTLFLKQFKNF